AVLMARVGKDIAAGVEVPGHLSPGAAWAAYEKDAGRVKRASTISNELLFWTDFWEYSRCPNLYGVTRDMVARWQDYLRATPTMHGKVRYPYTVNDALRNVCIVFSHLKKLRVYNGDNFFSGKCVPRLPVPKARPKYLTKPEI